jgi:hypothetical protein
MKQLYFERLDMFILFFPSIYFVSIGPYSFHRQSKRDQQQSFRLPIQDRTRMQIIFVFACLNVSPVPLTTRALSREDE